MPSYYDKVIVREVDGEKRSVVMFDMKNHTPTHYKLTKCGMEEVLETLNETEKNDETNKI